MSELLEGLNPVQQEAVLHGEGPLLLLAGAGSGKTRVVTHRIAHLLEQGVKPTTIVAVTFTNKAAREMAARVQGIVGEAVKGLTIRTFHSLGSRFLRRYADRFGRSPGFTIYDERDQLAMVKAALEDVGVGEADLAREVKGRLDTAKNAGLGADGIEMPDRLSGLPPERFGEAYESRMMRADAFDFGDLILRPAELLEQDEELCAFYRRWWQWLMVDEFQDTNAAQFRWLRAIAPDDARLFVVGDDDQSIYGWRGAEVENILNFDRMWPGARVLRLEQNYRSTGHILQAANGVIAHNVRRLGKNLWTDAGDGARLDIHVAPDGRAEARWIAGKAAGLMADEGFSASDIAILVRASHLTLDLEQAFINAGLPYMVMRGRAFFDRAEVRDALAYLRLLVNPNDEIALRRAIAAPPRGVGAKSLERLGQHAAEQGASLTASVEGAIAIKAVKGKAAAGLRTFMELLQSARDAGGKAYERVDGLLKASGLLDRLEDARDGRDRLANVKRLVGLVAEHEREAEDPSLGAFLETVKLVSDGDAPEGGGAVRMLTVHSAKGLEFPVVFIPGMEDGIFPHGRSLDEGDDEEERRLCYVALTRAERRLFLSRARIRRSFGEARQNPGSRFLDEIPEGAIEPRYVPVARSTPLRRRPSRPRRREPMEMGYTPDEDSDFRPGMAVFHAQFGVGRVVRVERGMRPTCLVEFPDVGKKKVVARFLAHYEG